MRDIESAFHQEMLNIYDEATQAGYHPTSFRRMVNEHGGVEAAHRLLAPENVTEGFTRLWELGRLDLTVEALILKPAYAALFSAEEREKARQRLEAFDQLRSGDAAPDSDSTPAASARALVAQQSPTPPTTQGVTDEAALEDAAAYDDTRDLASLEAWQASIQADERIARLVTEYPQWLADTFGERVEFRPHSNQRFVIRADGRLLQRGRFNQTDGLYVWFPHFPTHLHDELQHSLSKPSSLKHSRRSNTPGYRFIVYTTDDYRLLQEITEYLMLETDETDIDAPPDPDDTRDIASLEEWQQSLITEHPLVQRLAVEYPAWLQDTFGDQISLRCKAGGGLYVFLGTRMRQECWFRKRHGVYIWLGDPAPEEIDLLTQGVSDPSSLKELTRKYAGTTVNWRFHVKTAGDYELLQEVTRRMIERGNQPMTMVEAAYSILRNAGGGPLHVSDILQQALEQGLIETSGQTPQLSLSSVLLRDGRFNNLGKDMWVLAGETDATRQARPALPDYTPQIYAGSQVSFWRIYFDPKWWDEARDRGAIGVYYTINAGLSVQRMKQVQVGDRVIVWTRGGYARGVGVVTHPATDIRDTPDAPFAADLFGGNYTLVLGVRWSDELTEPVTVVQPLRNLAPALHKRITNASQTIVSLTRDDYITLLSLLRVDDIADVTSSAASLLNLHAYATLARQLGDQTATATELLERARATLDGLDPRTDADSFATLLRQLRLLTSDGAGRYRLQPYVLGDRTALLRLMALAYLHPAGSDGETYSLPARTIVPRLRDPSHAGATFAPEVGPDAPHLLAWYAEAGLVRVEGTDWHPLPDALAPLPGDDPTTTLYNRLLAALLAELAGDLADLPPVPLDQPLPPLTDLEERLRLLEADLIIDAQIVKRICRSLLAGRHVVLSGPPGTGKTELAKRLPALLWREPPQTFTRLMTGLDEPPVAEHTEQRQGYAVELVTATEDWGVRDVVGGIGPRLDGDGSSGTLRYIIEHGHLTRTVLRHFAATNHGRDLPRTPEPKRQDYRDPSGRYRGIWLVIDEFTRAPIDAAFGSLLTTLSGGEQATLAVPTAGGIERPIRLPRDFRIIGTLNSFDRHFLNQMSEALKRRFDFIDVLPPHPRDEAYEQGIAIKQALHRLHATGLVPIQAAGAPEHYRWEGVVSVQPDATTGRVRYTWQSDDPAATAALESFWRIFRAIRVFRQLGTAQAVAVYGNLFTGRVLAMAWEDALDTALADALADQLQVLTRDEQRTLDAYVEHAGSAEHFKQAIDAIFKELPAGRRVSFLYALKEADQQRHGTSSIVPDSATPPTIDQLAQVFVLGHPLQLPTPGAFRRRLRDVIGERGL